MQKIQTTILCMGIAHVASACILSQKLSLPQHLHTKCRKSKSIQGYFLYFFVQQLLYLPFYFFTIWASYQYCFPHLSLHYPLQTDTAYRIYWFPADNDTTATCTTLFYFITSCPIFPWDATPTWQVGAQVFCTLYCNMRQSLMPIIVRP